MATLGTMTARLDLLLQQHLAGQDLHALINRIDQEEVEAYAWSARRTNTVVSTTAAYTTGTLSVASGSNVVTGTGTAWTAAMTGWELRIGADDSQVAFTYVSPTAGTLSVPWPGLTQTQVGYVLFPLFYSIANAKQVLSINRSTALEETTREELNRKDPVRRQTGSPATSWAPAGQSASGDAQFELWPIDTGSHYYVVEYLKGHVEMVNPADLPGAPGAVIESKALMDAALVMCVRSGDPRWFKMAENYEKRYIRELENAKIEDLKQYGTISQIQDTYGGRRLGHDYISSHDIN